MGAPSFGSRCVKPDTLSISVAIGETGCIDAKSSIVGRFERCGICSWIKVTESFPPGPADASRGQSQLSVQQTRAAQPIFRDSDEGTKPRSGPCRGQTE